MPGPATTAPLACQAGVRASHVDRDRVVELLRVAAGDGRLTAEELDERLEAGLTARTYGELAALTTDLPAVPDSAPGAPAPEPKDLARIDCRGSSVKRDGRWLVPQRMEVRVTGGSVTLDFAEAVIVRPSLLLDADVSAGRLTLVTKPGVVVDTDEVAAEGSYLKVVRLRCGARGPAGCAESAGTRRASLSWERCAAWSIAGGSSWADGASRRVRMAGGTGWLGQDHRRAPDMITVVRQDRAMTAGCGQPPDPASRARARNAGGRQDEPGQRA